MAYFPARRVDHTRSFSPSPKPSESRCHYSCLKYKQLAMVWVACSCRFGTFSMASIVWWNTSKLLTWMQGCVCGVSVQKQRSEIRWRAKTGLTNTEALVFLKAFSSPQLYSLLFLLFSLPLLMLVCLFLVRAELLFICTKRGGSFFSPINFPIYLSPLYFL